MGTQARTADAVREKLADVEHWMLTRELPSKLRNQIREFYTDVSVLGLGEQSAEPCTCRIALLP